MGVENIRKREQERMEGLIISIIDLTFFFYKRIDLTYLWVQYAIEGYNWLNNIKEKHNYL